MKKLSNRTKATLFALLLVLTIAVPLMAVPLASAHTPALNIPTYSYVQVFPNPIGVNQQANIFAWLDKLPPTASGEYGDRWQGLTVTITKPDGSTQTMGPFTSDPVGTIFEIYTPDQIGTYSFQFNFPGQKLVGANPPPDNFASLALFGGPSYIGDTFTESTSEKVSLTVQSQQIASETVTPLPTGYWTRPIADSITGWQSIAGNWLGDGAGNPNTKGPESAHIVWTKPITFGGVASGVNNDAFYTGLSYESYWSPPLIINGVLYYNTPNPPMYGFKAVDLRTGQELWTKNGTGPSQIAGGFLNQNYPQLSFGQLLDYNSPNQHGYLAYLWSTYTTPTANPYVSVSNWAMYDAFTGNYICTIAGIPAGGSMFGASSQVRDAAGSILIYNVDLAAGTMTVWNSTAAILNSFPSNSPMANNGYWMWRPPLNGVVNGTGGITSVVPLSDKTMPPNAALSGMDTTNQVMVYSTGMAVLGMGNFPSPTSFTQFGISYAPNSLGRVLWTKTNPWPAGNVTLSVSAVGAGVYGVFEKETCKWWGYSTTTGNNLWGPTASETPLHMYGVGAMISNGKLYSSDSIGEGGTIYCYDAQTGTLKWSKTSESMGASGYWPNSPVSIGAIADNKLYIYGDEHSPGPTLEPGFKLRAWDANNGNEIWSIPFWAAGGFTGRFAVADGYLVAMNGYDNQIYSFGKGQTATTVAANPASATSGAAVLIQGTVTDQSPGAKGTPAIDDAYMGQWMQYLYQQAPKPSASGVQVSLTAISSSGTAVTIGTVTSDTMGQFKTSWTPPSNDLYTITASFAGSKSYFASTVETGLVVGSAASTTTTTATTSVSVDNLTIYLAIATVLIIIAIAVATVVNRRK
jgi:hypothetical protein